MVASTNADWAVSASSHLPPFGSVATSWYGVARPVALSGSAGTTREQSGLGGAAGAGAAVGAALDAPENSANAVADAATNTGTITATRNLTDDHNDPWVCSRGGRCKP